AHGGAAGVPAAAARVSRGPARAPVLRAFARTAGAFARTAILRAFAAILRAFARAAVLGASAETQRRLQGLRQGPQQRLNRSFPRGFPLRDRAFGRGSFF